MGFKAFSYLWVALKPALKGEKRTKKRTNLSMPLISADTPKERV